MVIKPGWQRPALKWIEAGKFLSCLENIPELHLFLSGIDPCETFLEFLYCEWLRMSRCDFIQTEKFCPLIQQICCFFSIVSLAQLALALIYQLLPAIWRHSRRLHFPSFPQPNTSPTSPQGIHIRALLYILQITLLDWAIWITATLLPLILISVPPHL